MQIREQLKQAKEAGKVLARLTDQQRNDVLEAVADAIIYNKVSLLESNARDLAKMEQTNPLYDRLQLTDSRLEAIAADMRNVAKLPSPLGRVTDRRTLPNGLRLSRVSVLRCLLALLQERQCLCAEWRARC